MENMIHICVLIHKRDVSRKVSLTSSAY